VKNTTSLKNAAQELDTTLEDRVLDAAEHCFLKFGPQKTSMADISTAANTSRATVYRYFKNRDAVIEGVMMRDAARLFREVLKHIEKFKSTEERVVESLIFVMEMIEKTPRLSSLLIPDAALVLSSSNLYQRLDLYTQPLFGSQYFNDLNKLRKDVSPNEMKEFLIQTVFGLLTLKTPASKTREKRRQYLKNFLLPSLLAQ